jgi:Glyoxalase-like domain
MADLIPGQRGEANILRVETRRLVGKSKCDIACGMKFPRLHLVLLDCPDPNELAKFYSALTGIAIETRPGYAPEDMTDIDLVHDSLPALSFQKVENYVAPTWPDGNMPKQMHLDFDVDDLDDGERHVLSIGARKADYQPGETFRVFLDPVGHPFCLIVTE